jgi:hypothetical protein
MAKTQCHPQLPEIVGRYPMTTYILERGSYQAASLGYSYARRAQSVAQTLRWHQVAIIDAENITEAVEEATLAIAQWSGQGFTGPRWRVEGRGAAIHENQEIYP